MDEDLNPIQCPICGSDVPPMQNSGGAIRVSCATCGDYQTPQLALKNLHFDLLQIDDSKRAVVSYFVRKMAESNKPAILSNDLIAEFLKRDLPTAAEQADNLILWLGGITTPGKVLETKPNEDHAIVGANRRQGFLYIMQSLKEEKLLVDSPHRAESAWLSFAGWRRYEELKRGRSHSKKAFMAMKFGDPILDTVYQAFKGAARQTGFDLAKNDEQPRAGIIDNNMRVEIQTSRFVVVDLTNNNLGAYWEAGFAEGLGKPVIYSCEKLFFEEGNTHFDANHLYTVKWKSDKLEEACKELKVAIRATFPDEAIMQDVNPNSGDIK